MKPTIYHRIRRRTASHDAATPKKDKQQEQSFFGDAAHETFFQPAPALQRKCADCDKEEKVQRVADKKEDEKKLMKKEDKKEDEKLQRSADKKEEEKVQKKETAGSSTGAGNVSSYVNSLNGKGNPLPAKTNHFFSARMGYDFSNVKVHTDKQAAESAKAVNAKVYTVGNNVVFNEGQYNEESGEGKKLMAHELVHIVQNRGGAIEGENFVSRKIKLTGGKAGEQKKFVTKMNDGSSVKFDLEADGNIKLKDATAKPKDEYGTTIKGAIDDAQIVNLNLIPKSDTEFIDAFASGNVDTADVFGLPSFIFKSYLLHYVVERFDIPNYEANKTTVPEADFDKAHTKGHEVQERFLKEKFPKKNIKFISEYFDESTRKEDKRKNGTIEYHFDYTDVKYVFVQPIKGGLIIENIISARLKVVK